MAEPRTVRIARNGKRIRLVPSDLPTAVACSQAMVLDMKEQKIEWLAAVGFEQSVLARRLAEQELTVTWDPSLFNYLKRKHRWYERHKAEYTVEKLDDAAAYDQKDTVEEKFADVFTQWLKEVEKRPYAEKLTPDQTEDSARLLMKDQAHAGHLQGFGKTILYGVGIDVDYQQKLRSIAKIDPTKARKPFALIICESKSVWDVQAMLRDVLGLHSAIVEVPGDEKQTAPVHIISYNRLALGREKFTKVECPTCHRKTDQRLCSKCKTSPRVDILAARQMCQNPAGCQTSVPHDPKMARRSTNAAWICPTCSFVNSRHALDRAMRQQEIATYRSGLHEGRASDSDREAPGLLVRTNAMYKRLAKLYSVVVVDESFLIQNRDTQRAGGVYGLRPKRRKYIGTGTLVDGVVNDCFYQYGWLCGFDSPLWPFKEKAIKEFEREFCQYREAETSTGTRTRRLVNRPSAMPAFWKLLYPKMVRRTKVAQNSSGQELLKPIHCLVPVNMDGYDRQYYAAFLEDFANRMERLRRQAEIDGKTLTQTAILSQTWALRAALIAPHSPKMRAALEYGREMTSAQSVVCGLVEKYARQNEKSLVFSGIVDGCVEMSKLLNARGLPNVLLTGKQSPMERQIVIDRWKKARELSTMVVSIEAEKTARTFIEANHAIFADLGNWSPLSIEQAWKRIHRFGQMMQCYVDYVCCAGTVQQIMFEVCAQKQADTNLAIDRRNVTDFRQTTMDAMEIAMLVVAQQDGFREEMRRVRDGLVALPVLDDIPEMIEMVRTPMRELLQDVEQ